MTPGVALRPRTQAPSLPLDRSRRLRGHIIHNPVDALDFVDDAGRDAGQEAHVEGIEVGGHAVERGHGAERHHAVIGARPSPITPTVRELGPELADQLQSSVTGTAFISASLPFDFIRTVKS